MTSLDEDSNIVSPSGIFLKFIKEEILKIIHPS